MLARLKEEGLENVLALRGDPPANQPDFDFSKNVYTYANELIHHIKNSDTELCIAAACYVEGHVDCKRIKNDMENLKRKVDEGVDFLVTQLFYDNRLFYEFLDKARAMGINCPIMPGIMPIFKADQIKRIASLCGASIPAKLVILMDKYQDNPEDMRKAGVEYASLQIRDLVESGVDGIHLLTMNRPKSSKEILENAGLL
jgi:methylenetetrahydrofolate reductase (NADPH)